MLSPSAGAADDAEGGFRQPGVVGGCATRLQGIGQGSRCLTTARTPPPLPPPGAAPTWKRRLRPPTPPRPPPPAAPAPPPGRRWHGLALEPVRRVADLDPAARVGAVDRPAALLHHVGQLVREHVLAVRRSRGRSVSRWKTMFDADRVGVRVDRLRPTRARRRRRAPGRRRSRGPSRASMSARTSGSSGPPPERPRRAPASAPPRPGAATPGVAHRALQPEQPGRAEHVRPAAGARPARAGPSRSSLDPVGPWPRAHHGVHVLAGGRACAALPSHAAVSDPCRAVPPDRVAPGARAPPPGAGPGARSGNPIARGTRQSGQQREVGAELALQHQPAELAVLLLDRADQRRPSSPAGPPSAAR